MIPEIKPILALLLDMLMDISPVTDVTVAIDVYSILPLLVVVVMGRLFYRALRGKDI
jgi:hypothetical protein